MPISLYENQYQQIACLFNSAIYRHTFVIASIFFAPKSELIIYDHWWIKLMSAALWQDNQAE
jgi:hypothetical protein